MLMTLHEWDDTLPGQEDGILTAPAIVAKDITARAFSEEDGRLQYYLTAKTLTQYDHNPLTEMQEPELEMANDKGSWTIVSEQGVVKENGDLTVACDLNSYPATAVKGTLEKCQTVMLDAAARTSGRLAWPP